MNELIVTFEGRNKLSEETKRVGALLLFPPTDISHEEVENLMNDLNQTFLERSPGWTAFIQWERIFGVSKKKVKK